jgi:hypothetical protein
MTAEKKMFTSYVKNKVS